MTLLEHIRTAPNVETWVTVIRLVMAGELDGYIEKHFSTVEDLMLTTIENSLNRPWAKTCFDEALEQVIFSWSPAATVRENSMETALRLLQTFRPRYGLKPLLSYMLDGRGFTAFRFDTERSDLPYLDLLAWNTLRSYFPLNDDDPSTRPAYEPYLRFVEGSLNRPATRALACRRLLELGAMKPDSGRLRELVVAHTVSLVTALVEWLDGSDRVDRDLFLMALYLHCTDSKEALTAFQITLERLGGRVNRVGARIFLTLSGGDEVSIASTEETNKETYFGWQDETEWLLGSLESTEATDQ